MAEERNSDEKTTAEKQAETASDEHINSDKSQKNKGAIPQEIEEEMKASYIDYSMSVIVGRALPDVRDGLKPVHRRILFTMNEMGLLHNKQFKKSARIVGDCLGKYHPHGDMAVYDALVRMAQDFSLRYPLVNGQGNFGSVDGDSPAAMRYTEVRMKRIAEEMLQDIDKETVDFTDNFDGSLKEPVVLPSKCPNLLINGSSGIAVGMATNIPPHNMQEVCAGIIKQIEHPDIVITELMEVIKGPDFPTSGIICGKKGIAYAYATGKGRILVKGRTHIEKKKDRESIIITEIPYMTNKAMLIEQIADLTKDKTIDGISDIRDESDRDGMRIVVELKKGANNEVVLNQLLKHSRLQSTFGIIMLALVGSEPRILNLKDMIGEFIKHRKEVVTRRTQFELRKAEERAHILEGIKTALDNLDEAIALIKAAKSVVEAKTGLMAKYSLTELQAMAVLDMKLQKLTSLEQGKLMGELKLLIEAIQDFKGILASEERIKNIIKNEIVELGERYKDERRTEISGEDVELEIEDLIEDECMVLTITHDSYVKRLPVATYKSQGRGGKGIIGATTKEEDFVERLFIANTHDYLLCFTDKGQVHWLKVYKVPECSRQAKGKAIINLLELGKDSKITATIPIKNFDDKHYLFMATKKGVIKKTNLAAFSRPRAGGILAINIAEGDELVDVKLTDGAMQIMLASANGLAVKFDEKDVRPMGRASAGVIGIRLRKDEKGGGDNVVGCVIADDTKTLLTVTENGYGKRTMISEYRLIRRGGSGVINIICSERNGRVVAAKSVEDEDEVMLMSQQGNVIRTRCSDISTIGRNTQGVRLMKLDDGDRVVGAAKVVAENHDENVKESSHD